MARWDDTTQDQVRALAAQGKYVAQIAADLGLNEHSVRKWLQRNGVEYERAPNYNPNEWPAEREERMRHLWVDLGWSASQIAKDLGGGLTRNAICGKAHRMGWTRTAEATAVNRALANRAKAQSQAKRQPGTKHKRRKIERTLTIVPRRSFIENADAEDAFARPWESRERFQCAWPVGGGRSCCRTALPPYEGWSAYCDDHRAKLFARGRAA